MNEYFTISIHRSLLCEHLTQIMSDKTLFRSSGSCLRLRSLRLRAEVPMTRHNTVMMYSSSDV